MEFKKLYAIAKTLADFIKDEYPDKSLVTTRFINQFCNSDYYAKLLLTKVDSGVPRIQIIFIIYFIISDPNMSQDDMIRNINNLYVVEIDWYNDEVNIKEECSDCGGEGYVSCDYCDNGEIDCRSCDGNGHVDCDECYGDGTETCGQCNGSGTQTEDDDEGEQIEVDCDDCDGEGNIRCTSCGGIGNFECPECDGKRYHQCGNCEGAGDLPCDYCGGNGEVDSDELYYDVTSQKIITIGNKISSEVGKSIDVDDFDEISDELLDNRFTYSQQYYNYKELTSEEVRQANGMESDFVTINWVTKLEDFIAM